MTRNTYILKYARKVSHIIYSVLIFYDVVIATRKQKMTKQYYLYVYHSSKIHTVYLTYASFFQMEDSQIPSTTFKGFSAPDDIVPHGSTDVTLQCH